MDIRVPVLAENVTSATVVRILVSEGQEVEAGQDIVELETEKAVATMPAPESGRVERIDVKEGAEVKVGDVVLSLTTEVVSEKPGTNAEKSPPAPRVMRDEAEERVHQEPVTNPLGTAADQAGLAAPAAPSIRKLARQLGIDLSRVRGTERGGRIVLENVRAYILGLQQIAFGRPDAAPKPETTALEPPDFSRWGAIRREPMSPLRKKIAEVMTASWRTVPHVTQFDEVDITNLGAAIKEVAPEYEKLGVRLTLTLVVLKALVSLLEKYPTFNASLDDTSQQIIFKDYFHFGIAVDTEHGLIVPVVRDVDKKRMVDLSRELQDLAERTRQRRVSLEELQGGTFTISNQGGIGGAHFTPIIYAPQSAILGLGRASLKPVVNRGEVRARMVLPVALSYDHRITDGATAARFIHDFSEALENFSSEALKPS